MVSNLSSILRPLVSPYLATPEGKASLARIRLGAANRATFAKWKRDGADYALNLATGELHRVRFGSIDGPHNLLSADLKNFFPFYDIGAVRISTLRNGEPIKLFEENGEFLGTFLLNRCSHCFPFAGSAFARLGAIHAN